MVFRLPTIIAAFSAAAILAAGCFASPPPPPAGSAGPPPTLTELLAQVEGEACVWIHGRRYLPGEASRVIRHPAQNCRIHAAREIAKLGPLGAAATPTLLAVLPGVADHDTGDGWLMVRTAILDALAAVADNPVAIPALVDATRSSGHGTGSAAAGRALVLGYDAKADLDLAAAAAPAGSAERLQDHGTDYTDHSEIAWETARWAGTPGTELAEGIAADFASRRRSRRV